MHIKRAPLAAIAALTLLAFAEPNAVLAAACVQTAFGGNLNCTAGDTRVAEITAMNVVDPCTGVGDTATIQLRLRIVANAANRYDIGYYVALDGGNAYTGNCYNGILTPVSATPSPASGSGPYLDDDGDACGDIEQDVDNLVDLPPLVFSCADADANGQLDISTVVAWAQNAADVCNAAPALPGNSAKCEGSTFGSINVPVPTATPSSTPTSTPSATPSSTRTGTATATSTATATNTPVNTATATATSTNTPVNTATSTATSTNTPVNTATATATSTNTPVNTATATATATNTPVNTATATATATSTNTPVDTATATATATHTPVDTATATATSTNTPVDTATATATATHTPVDTATTTATSTNTPVDTATATPTTTSTPIDTATATATATDTPADTATATATSTNTPVDTATATATPTNTPTATDTPVNTPTSTPTSTATATNTPINTATSTASATPTETFDESTPIPQQVPNIDLNKTFPGLCRQGTTTTMILAVRNIGDAPTSGPVTVTDPLPTGLTLIQASGSGWDCSGSMPTQILCVRNAILNGGSTAPPINVTLSVAADAAAVLLNTAVATTPGDLDESDGTASAFCRRNPVPAPAASPATLGGSLLLLIGIAGLAMRRRRGPG